MSDDGKKRQLGKGLSALLGPAAGAAAPAEGGARGVRQVPVGAIHASRLQPRRIFREEELADLTASIKEQGVLQPVLLRRHPDKPGEFELVAGERRWRATQAAGKHEIPALVRELSDREALEVALIENVQREDLTPLEEARAYERLTREFTLSQEEMAERVGKSRSHVSNTMRLLDLPPLAQSYLERGAITAGHARAILACAQADELTRRIVADDLSVRAAERLADLLSGRAGPRKRAAALRRAGAERDANIEDFRRRAEAALGAKVAIRHSRDKGSGTITLHYGGVAQLHDWLKKLGMKLD